MLSDLGRLRPALLLAAVALGTVALLADSQAAQPLDATSSSVHEGTRGDDMLAGSGGDDVIIGKAGDDGLRGFGGNDTLVAGPGRDRVLGGRGDDTINIRDRARDIAGCGPGWDTVVADTKDVVPASCEQAIFSIPGGVGDSGSTLLVATSSVNNGGGVVHLLLERPRMPLHDCRASECSYPGLPTTATALISPEGGVGTEPSFGGDCAGTGIPPCRLSMDQNRVANVIFNGSG
jgi:hypothetical protein